MSIILDLDNCISDDGWRINKILRSKNDKLEKYHIYHSLCGFDQCKNEMLFRHQQDIIVLTGRPIMYRPMTEHWLQLNKIFPKVLLMRNNYDFRSSVDLKRSMVDMLDGIYQVDLAEVTCAYDDREDIVAMYKAKGLEAHRVFIHDLSDEVL